MAILFDILDFAAIIQLTLVHEERDSKAHLHILQKCQAYSIIWEWCMLVIYELAICKNMYNIYVYSCIFGRPSGQCSTLDKYITLNCHHSVYLLMYGERNPGVESALLYLWLHIARCSVYCKKGTGPCITCYSVAFVLSARGIGEVTYPYEMACIKFSCVAWL